jgi:hypothetical protein
MPLLPSSPKRTWGAPTSDTPPFKVVFLHTESGFVGCSWGTYPCSPQFHALSSGRSGTTLRNSFLGRWTEPTRNCTPEGDRGLQTRPPERWVRFLEGKGHSLLATLSGWLSRFGSAVPRKEQSDQCVLWSLALERRVQARTYLGNTSGASRSYSRTGISDRLPCISPGIHSVFTLDDTIKVTSLGQNNRNNEPSTDSSSGPYPLGRSVLGRCAAHMHGLVLGTSI